MPLVRALWRWGDGSELYELLRQAGDNVERATLLLAQLLRGWPEAGDQHRELVDCEHEGDRITHDIIHLLLRRAPAPYEGSDVFDLASGLDDVVDLSEEIADFLGLYRVEAPMEQAIALAEVLREAGAEVARALESLRDLDALRPRLLEISRLEDEGDRIMREGVAALFEGGIDPMVVIRWKDIFERLEEAIDSCDRVAHVLEGISVKRA